MFNLFSSIEFLKSNFGEKRKIENKAVLVDLNFKSQTIIE